MEYYEVVVSTMKSVISELLQSDLICRLTIKYHLRFLFEARHGYLFGNTVAFKLYVHCGTLFWDIFDPINHLWGWDVGAVIQECVSRETIDKYLKRASSVCISVDGLERSQITEFVASVYILDNELPDILLGRLENFSAHFQSMTETQRHEIKNLYIRASEAQEARGTSLDNR